MDSRGIVTLVVVAVALLGAALLPRVEAALVRDAEGCPGSGDIPTSERLRSTRATILCLLNKERARHALPPLRRNALLELASQRHSEDMAARNFYAHESPDGIKPGNRMTAGGYPSEGTIVGENIHWGVGANSTPVRIVRDWMDSPGHRENILRPQFIEVGVGVAHEAPERHVDGRAGVYTTNFGGPLPPAQTAP